MMTALLALILNALLLFALYLPVPPLPTVQPSVLPSYKCRVQENHCVYRPGWRVL